MKKTSKTAPQAQAPKAPGAYSPKALRKLVSVHVGDPAYALRRVGAGTSISIDTDELSHAGDYEFTRDDVVIATCSISADDVALPAETRPDLVRVRGEVGAMNGVLDLARQNVLDLRAQLAAEYARYSALDRVNSALADQLMTAREQLAAAASGGEKHAAIKEAAGVAMVLGSQWMNRNFMEEFARRCAKVEAELSVDDKAALRRLYAMQKFKEGDTAATLAALGLDADE